MEQQNSGLLVGKYVTALGVAVAFTWPALAIEPEAVRVHTPELPPQVVATADSDRAQALHDSLIQPWVDRLPGGGERLSEAAEPEQPYYVLQVPMAVDRFTSGQLTLEGTEDYSLYLNGQQVQGQGGQYEIELITGDHQLLAVVGDLASWDEVALNWEGAAEHDVLDTRLPEYQRLSMAQIFDAPVTRQLEVSPDGHWLVWQQGWYSPETGDALQSDIVLYHREDETVRYRFAQGASQFSWRPDSEALAYVENDRVQLLSLSDFQVEELTQAHEGLSGLRWLDDTQLVFSWLERGEQDEGPAKRYRALEDRWSYFRDNSQLYVLDTETQALAQLTQASQSSNLQDIHNSGDRLLLSRRVIDYDKPPHLAVALFELQLDSGELTDLGVHRTMGQAFYGSDDHIYIVAGPEFADDAGVNLPAAEELLSNNYDGQLYRLTDGEVTPLSRDFDPAINGAMALSNGDLLLRVTDRATSALYRYRPEQDSFSRLDTGLDVVSQVTVTETDTPQLVFSGSGVSTPDRAATMAINDSSASVFWDSQREAYRDNQLPEVQDWNFRNERGDTIYGRVYYPADFDEDASYPALVYYYGGTTPVTRGFTGRYPFNLWADMGYVVYVLQPTGAIGYGQEFSARHVNAWGEYTVDDIIEGTERFLAEHRFVDADRVGHLGASYGGFMTMLLATKTDLFSASMSHAGISNITSYWGYGWWGFQYSGEASKGSFPWNNQELYVDQSPVFRADQVTAPMLLLHGDGDTNVPPGESHQMYTALKLLDKDVELVEYYGADHHIITRTGSMHWWSTYMSFFDKHLKDEPEWWEAMFPDTE